MRIKVSEVATPIPRNMTKLHQIKVSGDFKALPEGFWSAVDVWIKKPHVVNKRLCGAKETESRYVDAAELGLILQSHGENSTDSDVLSFLRNSSELIDGQKKQWSYSVRSLITKVNCYGENMHKDLVLKDIGCQRVTFIPIQENAEGQTFQKKGNIYQIQLHDYGCAEWFLELHAFRPEEWFSDGVAYPKLPWMSRELLPKLVRWATESRTSEFVDTLSLLPVEKYSLMYQQLKNKYKEMVQVWPEVTNPEKFVYEDVAIATYLLVLWGEEREENGLTAKQSFVDLGCGNGLLVHILSNEGHPGKGIDVRRRKIWDMYGPETLLEEAAITPSDCFLFPATDWLIGNHSDELTPWIPVVAARSSYACRYFVLPCCFFDFNAKYQRRRCKKSQYREYVDFIAEVSAVSGFHTEEDCLRIPSTKRVCLVGKSRNYTPTAEPRVEAQRARYIQARMTRHRSEGPRAEAEGHHDDREAAAGAAAPGNDWGTGFQPRERTEAVRNCAALPRDFIDVVVLQVANALLALNKEKEGGGLPSWNRGGTLSVREVADLLEQETLQVLKNECGGLQTLLKNNHQVFRVHGGAVQIRDWRPRDGVIVGAEARRQPPAPGTTKTRPCWFHAHHPTGCPLPTEDCAFAHGAADLRPSTRPLRKKKNAPH